MAYFQAKKDMRQGDPLSPFLFSLSIEYLTKCLGELKNEPAFNFHPKCERIHLNHLMFADDHSFVGKIMVAFNKFSQAYDLVAGIEKSSIYIVGVSYDEARDIATAVHLPVGDFPFKYHGVPLSAKKLNYSQCKVLVEKITERAQLVRSVLSSTQNY